MSGKKCTRPLFVFLIAASFLFTLLAFTSHVSAYTDPQPAVSLNIQQGPLGVIVTVKGQGFHPGQASLSYLDAQNTPGIFATPSDTSVQVKDDGSFVSTNVILPSSGPVGTWKILVTDSAGIAGGADYVVIAAPGEQTAGSPALAINPTSGASGDTISFNGSNWLPAGTAVNFSLVVGSSSESLLATAPLSDKNGMIVGTFHLPSNLSSAQAVISALDAATGDLRAQAQMFISAPLPTPTPTASPSPQATATPKVTPTASPSPTAVPTFTPTPTSTASPVVPAPGGSNTPARPSSNLNKALLGPLLLLAGALLGLAALLMVLFLLPSAYRKLDEQVPPQIGG